MNKSKRFFVCFFIAIFVMTTVTACGGNTSVAIPATEETVDQNAVDYQGEGQVQGGIKSDDEIAALQEEEQQYIDNNTTEYESNEGHEPESFGSGNFQDYWQGEDFFDIVSYLKDNGCDEISYYDGYGSRTDNESEAYSYIAYFNGYEWKLYIAGASSVLTHLSDDDTSGTPEYTIFSNEVSTMNVSLSRINNAKCSSEMLQYVDTIISALKTNRGSLDPLSNTELNYAQTK